MCWVTAHTPCLWPWWSKTVRALGGSQGAGYLAGGDESNRAQFHVVTNMPLGPFEQHPAVQSAHVISDRRINTRALSDRVRKRAKVLHVQSALFFSLGRVGMTRSIACLI